MEGLPEANSDEILESYPGAEEASDSRFDDVTLRILGYHLIRLLQVRAVLQILYVPLTRSRELMSYLYAPPNPA